METNENPTQIAKIVSLLQQTDADPIVLRGDCKEKVVVISPKLVGRVICAGMNGLEGHTNAFVNPRQIQDEFSTSGYAARSGPGEGWNNFGGMERIWFAPEAGPYGFFFEPGVEQNWHNYRMSHPLHSLRYKITENSHDDKSVAFTAPVELTNYSGQRVSLEMTRQISLLEDCPFVTALGGKVDFVGFESRTWAKNTGDKALDKQTTPTAIWTLGQFNPGPQVILLLPYAKGPAAELGEPVTTEYFRYFLAVDQQDKSLARHWSIEESCVLIKADGKVQLKLEMLKRRTLGRLAAVDLQKNEITIVDFDVYPQLDYAASFFKPYEGDLLDGGAMSTFMNVGEPLSVENPAFFELETCSPIMELQPNQEFCHVSRTYQVKADRKSLMQICERFFQVEETTLTTFDQRSG